MTGLVLTLRPRVATLDLAASPCRLSFDFAPVLRGPAGPIGPAGGAAFQRTSGAALSALRVVWEDDSGVVHLLDYRDDAHIDMLAGITLTAAGAAGQLVTLQRAGVLDAAGLGLVPGRVWLGADGALTQTPPADGFDVLIGAAVAAGRLMLDVQDHITLE
ncbi:MAG: hypothetical protein ACK4KV_09620 [Rhodocyclaceae bacterium]